MNRLGVWSASALCVIGVAYLVTLAAGFASAGFDKPIVDPVLAVMETLTLLSAPILVVLMAAIHASAAPRYKVHSLIAFAFMRLMAGLTSSLHFAELTAVRQSSSACGGVTVLAPEIHRRGGGRRMAEHARARRGPLTVDVNEQNTAAVGFYAACGFVVYGRSELDDNGRPYPLLHMRLEAPTGTRGWPLMRRRRDPISKGLSRGSPRTLPKVGSR